MTDRHAGYLITLSEDIREDDAEAIIQALQMIRGVQSVTPIVSDLNLAIAHQRAKSELVQKLFLLIKELQ